MYALRDATVLREVPPRWPRLVRESALDTASNTAVNTAANTAYDIGASDAPFVDPALDTAASDPPSVDSDDQIFLLGERCAQAYMQADALHYRAMRLLAEFHRREGWRDTGFTSTAEWLAWRIGIKPNAARERLRTALALESLPLTSEAMRQGELSFAKVRSLTRVARPDTEAALLDFARAGSAANLERVVRGWKTLDRGDELTAEQVRHRSRRFSAFVDDDGMVVVRGRLDPEVGALLMRAVEAASDALYRGGSEGPSGCFGEGRTHEEAKAGLPETTPEQRRADAVGLIAERALTAGFGGRCVGGRGDGGPGAGPGGEESEEGQTPISGTRAERYQVMLHVDADALKEGAEAELSELEDGTRVTAVTSRRIACDSGLVTIARGPDGQIVGAGRRTRTVPPSVRRALEARDRGCRFPGCGLRFTDAHHVKHWADGGETNLRNLVLLCRRHHRAVHEGGVRVCIDLRGQVVFFTPRGKALPGAPPAGSESGGRTPVRGRATDSKVNIGRPLTPGPDGPGHDQPGQPHPHPLAGAPRRKRDADIPWAVEARVWEALDSG